MPGFSKSSKNKLSTCHPKLQDLMNRVIKTYDCTIIQGHRSEKEQLVMYNMGRSKVKYGKHNENPSMAVDVAPYVNGGIPWPDRDDPSFIKDLAQFYHFAGYVLGTAESMGITIRWGGDWDRDFYLGDQSFDDLPHFEIYDD